MTDAPCIGNDPTCPCQDGDLCHYKGENPWPIKEKSMTDAPMTPREFAEKLYAMAEKSGDGLNDLADAEKVITERDAEIRREAQAEAIERAAKIANECIRCCGDTRRMIRALSPDPTYRERIEAQARLEEAEWWHATMIEEPHLCGSFTECRRLNVRRADLARLAADAEKEGK